MLLEFMFMPPRSDDRRDVVGVDVVFDEHLQFRLDALHNGHLAAHSQERLGKRAANCWKVRENTSKRTYFHRFQSFCRLSRRRLNRLGAYYSVVSEQPTLRLHSGTQLQDFLQKYIFFRQLPPT